MTYKLPVEVSYMMFAPYKPKDSEGKPTVLKKPGYAPYFFDVDIRFIKIGSKKVKFDGVDIRIELEVLDNEVLTADCIYELSSGLSEAGLNEKNEINSKIRRKIIKDLMIKDEMVEEYTSLLLRNIKSAPDEFVKSNKYLLARMVRSLDKKVDDKEAEEILSSRTLYSKSDMTIIDWEAAIIITDEGDFESDLELIKIGNYQLIRYRMLDKLLDKNISEIRENIKKTKTGLFRNRKDTLKKVVESQMELILHFDKIDQSLLLIGDWYSAKLYRIIFEEFYINEWRANVKEKLETLASIDEIVRDSLVFSWKSALEVFQTAGWVFLLLGYFALFFLELTR